VSKGPELKEPATVECGELEARISKTESEQIKYALQKGLLQRTVDQGTKEGRTSSSIGGAEGHSATTDSTELLAMRKFDTIHLTINLESGALLPLALRGRLKHGRHFTFKSVLDSGAITFVSPTVDGSFVDTSCPYASRGPWLQIFISDDFLPTLVEDLADLADPDEVRVPVTYRWPDKKLYITITAEDA
ncbi:hypothetical protein SK128_007167, partial [Halocaridina rubra]